MNWSVFIIKTGDFSILLYNHSILIVDNLSWFLLLSKFIAIGSISCFLQEDMLFIVVLIIVSVLEFSFKSKEIFVLDDSIFVSFILPKNK